MKSQRMFVFFVDGNHCSDCYSYLIKLITVEAPVSGHPREAEKVSATGAGRLRKCVNTEFV